MFDVNKDMLTSH